MQSRGGMSRLARYAALLYRRPGAVATIRGSSVYPDISGTAWLYQTGEGVLVVAEVHGLPTGGRCAEPIFGFHIHEGGSCTGNAANPFANALGHYNPNDCLHPYHAGDLPPLFGCDGYALSLFLTDGFTLGDVVGRTMIIHANPDDFTTQPSGNAGTMMACGVIRAL